MQCIKCKKDIPDDSIFCNYCGKKQVVQQRKTMKRPNGTGTVYKLKGNRRKPYIARVSKLVVTPNNKNTVKQTTIGYFETKTEALLALEKSHFTPIVDEYNLTVNDIYTDWAERKYNQISASAADTYRSAWLYFDKYKKVKMRDFSAKMLQNIIDTAFNEGKSQSTCQKIRTVASHICKEAMKAEIINKDISQIITMPKFEKKEKEIFSDSEINTLWENKENDIAKIILILIQTGMRINELFSIEIKNVYLDNKYMVGGEKTEAGKNRIIPISDSIFPFVKEFYTCNQNNKFLITSTNKEKKNVANFRNREFYPFLESVGILRPGEKRLTPHCTRHTFASNMVKKGVQPEVLQKILGHEKYQTTVDTYTHFTTEDINSLLVAVNK